MSTLSIGFSGTRFGMSQIQKDILFRILADHQGFFHHGDCIGADAEAHDVASAMANFTIHVHPPIDSKLRAFKQGHVNHPPKQYWARNADIVDQCHYLIACPLNASQQTGGTWNTIKYAMRPNINRRFTIITYDGTIGHSVLETPQEVKLNQAKVNWQ